MVNAPLRPSPVGPGWIAGPGWVCVLWWNWTSHEKADAGSVPSSGSDAEPVNVIVSPASYVVPAIGLVTDALGRVLLVTKSVAALLVALPSPLLTTTRNCAPSSA